MPNNHRPKIVLVGATAVGKTSIVSRYKGEVFNSNETPTLGAGYSLCSVPVGTADRTVELQVWDTAGQERFRSMAPIYYRNAVAAIIVYDVTVMETLRSAQRWAEELRLHLPVDMVICVVGNKIDLSYRCVLREQGQQYADSIHALYSETSALTGEGWATQVPAPAPVAGVSHTFEQLAHAIIAKQDKHDAEFVASFSLPPTSNETKVKKNKCCG